MSLSDREYFRYLTVSRKDRQWGLYATGGGEQLFSSPTEGEKHPKQYRFCWEQGRILSEYGVLFLTQGQCEFESKVTTKKSFTAGHVFLLFPGVWHRYRIINSSRFALYWVTFNGAYANHLVRRGFISPENPIMYVGLDDTILSSCRRFIERLKSDSPGLQQLLASNIMEILGDALTMAKAQQIPGETETLIQKAKLMLQKNTEEIVDIQDMAITLGLGYDTFRRAFKEQIGLAPHQYHLQLRIARAKELLHSTDFSVKQIAAALKFEDPYYFSKIFKKYVGVSPLQWRGAAKNS